MVKVQATPKFVRLAKKLMTQEALQKLTDTLSVDPERGSLLTGTGGIRKIRWVTGKGGGKRGGIRVLYYYDGEYIVFLITLFKKSGKENIDSGEKEVLRKLINELFGE